MRIKAVAFGSDSAFHAFLYASVGPGPTIADWIPRSSRGTTQGWVKPRYDTGKRVRTGPWVFTTHPEYKYPINLRGGKSLTVFAK